jgi:hypothetical protein
LKLQRDEALSSFDFNFNLRRYNVGDMEVLREGLKRIAQTLGGLGSK